MGQALTTKKEAEVADNVRLKIVPGEKKLICHWDEGYMDDDDNFVRLYAKGYIFEGAAYDALADAQDFYHNKSNYANIRDVVYAALVAAGQI